MTEFAQFSADESSEDMKELIIKNCALHSDGPCGDYDLFTAKTNNKKRE